MAGDAVRLRDSRADSAVLTQRYVDVLTQAERRGTPFRPQLGHLHRRHRCRERGRRAGHLRPRGSSRSIAPGCALSTDAVIAAGSRAPRRFGTYSEPGRPPTTTSASRTRPIPFPATLTAGDRATRAAGLASAGLAPGRTGDRRRRAGHMAGRRHRPARQRRDRRPDDPDWQGRSHARPARRRHVGAPQRDGDGAGSPTQTARAGPLSCRSTTGRRRQRLAPTHRSSPPHNPTSQPGSGVSPVPVHVYADAIALRPGKTVRSITLPRVDDGIVGMPRVALHVFALGVG